MYMYNYMTTLHPPHTPLQRYRRGSFICVYSSNRQVITFTSRNDSDMTVTVTCDLRMEKQRSVGTCGGDVTRV